MVTWKLFYFCERWKAGLKFKKKQKAKVSTDFLEAARQTLTGIVSLPQASSRFPWTAATWCQACWPLGRATECRPFCPCPTAACRGCRPPRGHRGATAAAAAVAAAPAPAGAPCPSASSCPWRRATAWAWWGPKVSWPPRTPGRSSPRTAPSSCTRRRPRDSRSPGGQPQRWTEFTLSHRRTRGDKDTVTQLLDQKNPLKISRRCSLYAKYSWIHEAGFVFV